MFALYENDSTSWLPLQKIVESTAESAFYEMDAGVQKWTLDI